MPHIEDIASYAGQRVTLKGWLANRRSSGKIHFLQIRDGSGFIQGVMVKAAVGDEMFAVTGVAWLDRRQAHAASLTVDGRHTDQAGTAAREAAPPGPRHPL